MNSVVSHERPSLGDWSIVNVKCPPLLPPLHMLNWRCATLVNSGVQALVTLIKKSEVEFIIYFLQNVMTKRLVFKMDLPKFPQMCWDVPCSCSVMLEMWMCYSCARFQVLHVPEVQAENQPGHCAGPARPGEHMGWSLLWRLLQGCDFFLFISTLCSQQCLLQPSVIG